MLKFISLTVEDFGPFKGVQTIDFTSDDGVTFIWGLNGCGKTTLLNIFRFAIYGEFLSRGGGIVDPIDLANREAVREGRYNCKAVLHMQYGGEDYWLTRQYKLRAGVTRPTKTDDYERETTLKKGTVIESNNKAEHILRLIMPTEVSRFFLFDGELLQEYADLLKKDSESGDIIKSSIERILGLPILSNGATDTGTALDSYNEDRNVLARKNNKTKQLGSKISALALDLQKNNEDLEAKKAELLEQNTRHKELKGKLDSSAFVQKLLGNLSELQTALVGKKTRRDELLTEISGLTKDSWRGVVSPRVATILAGINVDIKVLEEKELEQQISSRLLDGVRESIKKKHCEICERDIEDEMLAKLEERIRLAGTGEGALSADERAQLGSLRYRRGALEAISLTSNKETLAALERQLNTLTVEISDTDRDIKTIKETLSKHGDNITEMSAAMEKDLDDMAQCIKKIDVLNECIDDITKKVADIKALLTSLKSQLDKSDTSTEMGMAKRRIELCEQIHNIFEEGIDAYSARLKTNVEKDATDLFVQITNDPNYVRLEITDNYGLHIIHKDGDIVPLRSSGFEHVVAIALIGALHKNAPLRGPIIMDSPMFRLDPIHKEKVTKLLPVLSDQLVFLFYTHEIDEQFARQTLGTALKKEYRLTKQTSYNTRIEPN